MMRGIGFVGITAALLMPSQAGAAGQHGMRPIDAKTAQFNMYNFTDCVVRVEGDSPKFRAMMRILPGDPKFVSTYLKTVADTCGDELSRLPSSTVRLDANAATMRDLLFGALYRREFRKSGPPAGVATVAPWRCRASSTATSPGSTPIIACAARSATAWRGRTRRM